MELKEFYHDIHVWLVNNGPNFIIGIILFFVGLWFIKFLRTSFPQPDGTGTKFTPRYGHSFP
jgi:hypothetical protein